MSTQNVNVAEPSAAEFKRKLLDELKNASPLDTFSILERVEMYDAKDAREIIDDVYEQFESGEQRVDTIVVPVFTSIVDGLLKDSKVGDELSKKGLTATRIVAECQSFSYDDEDTRGEIYSEIEKNRIVDEREVVSINNKFEHRITQDYDRKIYEFTDKQRAAALERSRDKDTGELLDGYTKKKIYEDKKTAKVHEGNESNSVEVDHILPLKAIHDEVKNNCMLTDSDLRKISSIDENLVASAQSLNRSKQDVSNKEYVEKHKNELDKETQKRMIEMENDAKKAVHNEANKTVLQNMKDKEMRGKLGNELEGEAQNAAAAGVQFGIGNLLVEIIKPLYYELSDTFLHGFKEGVGASSAGEAFKIRLSRLKNYVMSAFLKVGATSTLDIIKVIVSAVVGAIIDLFFGIVKQILTLIKKGFPVAVSAIKILADSKKSASEKGDAVLKLLGGALISILGGMLISKLDGLDNIAPGLKNILGALITGCGSLIFMSLLDKLDIFSVNAEKRAARIKEIFDARIADMEERAACMHVEVIQLLGKQRICFDELINGAERAIDEENVDDMVKYSYSLANFFKVELEYSTTAEFVQWWDSQSVISI